MSEPNKMLSTLKGRNRDIKHVNMVNESSSTFKIPIIQNFENEIFLELFFHYNKSYTFISYWSVSHYWNIMQVYKVGVSLSTKKMGQIHEFFPNKMFGIKEKHNVPWNMS